jgi:hypothetical protein
MLHPCCKIQIVLFWHYSFKQTRNSRISLLEPKNFHVFYFFDLQSTTTSAHKVDYVQLSYHHIIFNSIHLTFLLKRQNRLQKLYIYYIFSILFVRVNFNNNACSWGGRDVFDRLLWLTFSVICSTFTLVVWEYYYDITMSNLYELNMCNCSFRNSQNIFYLL